MRFVGTELPGVFAIEPERIEDERGFFARVFCEREFAAHGFATHWVQSSISYNARAHTLRGMHFQTGPHAEIKLIRCTRGAIHDVLIDLRPDSPAYLRHVAVELTEANRNLLYVPEGIAHGFLTLAPETEVFYQMSAFYAPESARGVRWDDPAFGIAWPAAPDAICERDATYPDFEGTA
jgi:dTDP-4-dehydrorhamnose 3,5-epimerase